jgi:hypothetical protein
MRSEASATDALALRRLVHQQRACMRVAVGYLVLTAQPGLQVVPHGARFAHPPDPTAHDEFRRCVARRYQIVGLSETAKRWRSPLVDTGEVARIARSAVGEVPHQRARHPEPYHRRREPSSAAAGLGGWAAVRGDE